MIFQIIYCIPFLICILCFGQNILRQWRTMLIDDLPHGSYDAIYDLNGIRTQDKEGTGSPGLVVTGGHSWSEDQDSWSNPSTVYWMYIFHINLTVMFVVKYRL